MAIKRNITNYRVFNNKNINKRIVVLADIHYYQKSEIKRLNKISNDVFKLNPDYICIPGDMFDESFVKDEEIFIEWLKKLSNKFKIFIVLGNHDMIVYNTNKKVLNYKFLSHIDSINNIHVLLNDEIIVDDIRFIGFTYYHRYDDDSDYLVRHLNKKNYNYSSDKYNILLCHSPISMLERYDDIDIFNSIDLSIYGHMHGGLMPTMFRKIFKDRGFVNPRTYLFPKYCYGYIKKKKAIISTGITKLSHKNPFYKFNFLFRSEIVVIDLIS